ncbi:hypothetical protein HanRHA438_Chr15g0723131 [Helianthus annuus]|uniref:Transposase (putative) gypsy type domain-containing protein n=1 Tax=Helianthus annuus TaxID=4232 RepID=A0A9K3H3N4_HELAN|nr:hypothetical protein HanXRQr2_Chr15g0710941 [Helianthus annuus]KAJ0452502.1 hypothetical protein HanHA300_Chr15g0579691 [Helianthus annuus]KAJ0457422.1 hypothetical protein HanIR_Chr15g0773591 [Helianthus annuus]KAJ0474403.1 hypothetical protein HanHA89_Chr15g0629341 [Helianthus annuus]KAJ0649967.1 hypothetical protein HanLR1_Chr15g0590331 [Helianthus annuus]
MAFLLLSLDVAPPDWMSVHILTVHFPIALNAMGINTQRFPTIIPLLSPASFKFQNPFSSFPQISLVFSSSLCISGNMSTSSKPSGTKKRQSRPKNPPGPNQAMINRKEEELHNQIQNLNFPMTGVFEFPTASSTALDAPLRYISLYAAFFREGNFRLPMSRLLGEVLTRYGIHVSQVNALGLPRVTHFEFICRAQKIEPTFEMFNVFYYVTYTGGFYSFNSRTAGVLPCSRDPLKSFHDWKQKFFYIQCGVILIDMHYRSESEGVPKEKALVAAGMSLLWVPRDPRAYPVYAYKGKAIFVAGEMAMAALPVGEPKLTEWIRDNFLHPSYESIDAYGTVVLGALEARNNLDKAPTREETILLSSEEYTGLSHYLIHRSSRAGAHHRPGQDSTAGDASTPPIVDLAAVAAGLERKETRRKKAEEGEIEKRKSAEE